MPSITPQTHPHLTKAERDGLRNKNTNGMSLKAALKRLGGDIKLLKAQKKQAAILSVRAAVAAGESAKDAKAAAVKQFDVDIAAIQYAMAALRVFAAKFPGKSALKMQDDMGLNKRTPKEVAPPAPAGSEPGNPPTAQPPNDWPNGTEEARTGNI